MPPKKKAPKGKPLDESTDDDEVSEQTRPKQKAAEQHQIWAYLGGSSTHGLSEEVAMATASAFQASNAHRQLFSSAARTVIDASGAIQQWSSLAEGTASESEIAQTAAEQVGILKQLQQDVVDNFMPGVKRLNACLDLHTESAIAGDPANIRAPAKRRGRPPAKKTEELDEEDYVASGSEGTARQAKKTKSDPKATTKGKAKALSAEIQVVSSSPPAAGPSRARRRELLIVSSSSENLGSQGSMVSTRSRARDPE